ncbi:XkdX family protein [Oscillibacter hominis]|uniref:XkdX family protein n=1 Tax=Oscillibacter hominis TaxID=2763056 RepID=A0A7G9B822_9FIRM|nr:XkdX family protein [Oscillibacter hominis]QNL45703.1 XkdX family protein [Oscillibacter hominis]
MNTRANALRNLYRCGKLGKDGLNRAVVDAVITASEYREITGEDYV